MFVVVKEPIEKGSQQAKPREWPFPLWATTREKHITSPTLSFVQIIQSAVQKIAVTYSPKVHAPVMVREFLEFKHF